jgi:hypothetical protein
MTDENKIRTLIIALVFICTWLVSSHLTDKSECERYGGIFVRGYFSWYCHTH